MQLSLENKWKKHQNEEISPCRHHDETIGNFCVNVFGKMLSFFFFSETLIKYKYPEFLSHSFANELKRRQQNEVGPSRGHAEKNCQLYFSSNSCNGAGLLSNIGSIGIFKKKLCNIQRSDDSRSAILVSMVATFAAEFVHLVKETSEKRLVPFCSLGV